MKLSAPNRDPGRRYTVLVPERRNSSNLRVCAAELSHVPADRTERMLHWRIQLKKDSGQSASPGLSSQARPGNLFRDSTYRHATNPTVVDYPSSRRLRTRAPRIISSSSSCRDQIHAKMMARSRRGVKFPHRNANGHSMSADGRRASFSEGEEAASPRLAKSGSTLKDIAEVSMRKTDGDRERKKETVPYCGHGIAYTRRALG